jgi:hypothetical protein
MLLEPETNICKPAKKQVRTAETIFGCKTVTPSQIFRCPRSQHSSARSQQIRGRQRPGRPQPPGLDVDTQLRHAVLNASSKSYVRHLQSWRLVSIFFRGARRGWHWRRRSHARQPSRVSRVAAIHNKPVKRTYVCNWRPSETHK